MLVCLPRFRPHRLCMRVWACGEDDTYIIIEELHDKGGHAAVNTNEEVDAGQHHVSCAGHAEDEGERVHHGRDSPA